jgi:GNAT superfamily N-acetyltransferase
MGAPVTTGSLRLIRETFAGCAYSLPDESVEVELDGRVISHVGIFWRTIELLEYGPLEVGGVGLVVTHPQWRRLGLATACMEVARRRSALHGRPHLALFAGPLEQRLYRTLGYTETNVPTLLTLPMVGDVLDKGERW